MQYNIQALRAFAAYAVIGHHVLEELRNQVAIGRFFANPHIGATGVNLFFVISGFIMAMTTAAPITPGKFLYHRIARIVPIYWMMTAFTLALIVCGFAMFGHHQGTDWREAITSFLFVPDVRPGRAVPRDPVLFVGWTLDLEMMFYVIFAAALMLRGDGRLIAAIVIILQLWLAHLLTTNNYVRWIGDDVILGFALGILLWRASPALPTVAAIALVPLGVVILATPDLLPPVEAMPHRELIVTAGAGMLVLAAVALERNGWHVGRGWIAAQGDASYSLYLVHAFVLQAVGKLAVKTGNNETSVVLCIVVLVMFAASIIVGTIFHRVIERPITDYLRKAPQRPKASKA